MSRLLFAGEFLRCLEERDRRRIVECIREADIGVLRPILYSNMMLIASLAGCRGPYILQVVSHDVVSASFGSCRDPEAAAWELVELLEALPGVWYVKTEVEDGRVRAETVPYSRLWSFLWGW